MTTRKNKTLLKNFIKTLKNSRRYRLVPNTSNASFVKNDRHRYKLVFAMAHFAGLDRTKLAKMTSNEVCRYVARAYGLSFSKTVVGKLNYYKFNNRLHAAKFMKSHVLGN